MMLTVNLQGYSFMVTPYDNLLSAFMEKLIGQPDISVKIELRKTTRRRSVKLNTDY